MSDEVLMFISLIGFISIISFVWGLGSGNGSNPLTPFVIFFSLLLLVAAFILIVMAIFGLVQGEFKDASRQFMVYGGYCIGVAAIQFVALFCEDVARAIKTTLAKNKLTANSKWDY